jgi:nucleoside-diphosphate-sugar epimerase
VTALILGASSLVGRFLVPLAQQAGQGAISLGRSASGPASLSADLTAPDLASRLPKADLVYACAPIWLMPAALEALANQGMRRLIAFSSTSRFTKAASANAAERAVAKRLSDAEDAVMAYCQSRAIGWTILRPTLIYAEGQDQNISRLARLIGQVGFVPVAGAGLGQRQPVHAADLAAAAVRASTCDSAINKAYDLPGGETLSYRTMVERVFIGMGRRPSIVSVPLSVWQAGLWLASPLLPGATGAMGARMAQDLVFDAAAAKTDLDWQPRAFAPQFNAA